MLKKLRPSSVPTNKTLGTKEPQQVPTTPSLVPNDHHSLEVLENRIAPASLYVGKAGSFSVTSDQGAPGLDAGDTVTWNPGAGSMFTVVNGLTFGTDAFTEIQLAVTQAGVLLGPDDVFVSAGTFAEDVLIDSALSLRGSSPVGPGASVISGVPGGDGATVRIAANNVELTGFTITREGNNLTDWNDPTLNSAGVAIQGLAVSGASVHDNHIVGNRTGIDVNHSGGHTIRNNVVENNHTGLIFRNQTENLVVTENAIVGNRTVGVLFLDASGGTNTPAQSAAGSAFFNNKISGNWYGQIVDRQAGEALSAPGTNVKDFSGNYFGTPTPSVTTANGTEPGYASLVPVAFGGTATAPSGQPEIAGPGSGNFDFSVFLNLGTDTNVETAPGRGTFGFQGDFGSFAVSPDGAQSGPGDRIQEAIDLLTPGGTIVVGPGAYDGAIDLSKAVTLELAGPVTVSSLAGVAGSVVSLGANTLTVGDAADTAFFGTITGMGGLTKEGTGTLILVNNQSYTGSTTVVAGTLVVNGSNGSSVILQAGATLGGAGTVSSITAQSGANVAPGNSPGILNTGDIAFTSGSVFTVEVNGPTPGTDHDQLNVAGTVSLGGATLSASGTISSAAPQQIVLINNDGTDAVTGTFDGLAEGSALVINGIEFAVSYIGGDGNDVTLYQTDTHVHVDGSGNLYISSINSGTADNITIALNGSDLVISNPSVVLSSTVPGATGSGTSTVTIPLAALTGSVFVDTGDGDDTLTLDLSGGNFIPAAGLNYTGGGAGNDSLVINGGSQGTVTYNYTNANDGSVVMSNFGTVNYVGLEPITNTGTATDVIFNLPAGGTAATLGDDGVSGNELVRLSGATFETTDFANPSGSITINRGDASDTVAITAVPDLSASLTVGSAGNGFSSVTSAAAITLGAGQNLSITTTGAISLTGAVSVSGSTTLAAGAGDITLSNAANDFGTLAITSGSNVVVADANSVNLGVSAISGTFDVTTSGAVTQSGALSVIGVATIAAGVANDITLSNAANNFSTITITSGNNVAVADANSVILGASTVSGTFGVTVNGSITQSGALSVAGATTLSSGAGSDILLANAANNFSTFAVTSANNVTVTDANAIDLGASTISGVLNVTASGAVTQSGALAVAGATTISAGAANDITLTNAANNFSTFGVATGNNVAVTDVSGIILGASAISGTFGVAANGAVTQSGALSITGVTTLAAGAANNITLTTAANNFSTIAVTSGNNVSITDTNAVTLASVTTAGTFTVTASGNVSNQAGAAINVAGNASVSAGAGTINLGNQAGDTVNFGRITFNSTGAVSINEDSATLLGGANTASTLSITSAGALTNQAGTTLTATGNATLNGTSITLGGGVGDALNFSTLGVTATTGSIFVRDSNALILSGAQTLAGNGSIDIANGGTALTLDVTGLVSANGSGSILLSSSGALILGDVVAGDDVVSGSGNINLLGASAVTLNAARVTTTGDALIDADSNNSANTGPITMTVGGLITADDLVLNSDLGTTLNTSVNTLTAVNQTSGDIVINEANGLALNLITNTTGNVSITLAAGAITDNNGAANNVTAGTLTISAASGIDADTTVTTVNATVTGTGNIDLLDLAGGLSATANTTDGAITLRANSGNLVLATVSAGNGGTLNLSTTTSGNVLLGNVSTTGAASVTSVAGIEENGGDAAADLTADSATFTAATGIGAIGSLEVDILTGGLSASVTGTGAIDVTDTSGGISVTSATTADGLIALTVNHAGSLSAGTVTAGGTGRNVTLSSLGSVSVGNVTAAGDTITVSATTFISEAGPLDAGADLTASVLSLTAGSGIGTGPGGTIETAASSLSATTNTSGISLANTGVLTVTGLTASTSGAITLANTGALSTTGVVSTASGAITLSAASPLTIGANVTATGAILLTAGEVDDDPIWADDFTLTGGATIQSTAGNVTLRAGDDIQLDAGTTVNAFGTVTLQSGFGDLDGAGSLNVQGTIITGTALNLSAADDIVVGAINAPGQTVTLTADSDNDGDGGVFDTNDAGVDVIADALIVTASLNANAAAQGLAANTGIKLETQVNNLTASVGLAPGASTGNLIVTNTGALIVTNAETNDGNIALAASGQVTLTSVTAGGSGDITIDTTSGANVLVGLVTATGDDITINSAGNITDNNAGSNNFAGLNLSLTAVSGIGAADALESAISSFGGANTTGNIQLTNTGALTLTGVLVTGASGGITINASSPITIAANESAPGAISHTAGEISDSPTFADDLTINAGVSVTSTGSSVTLLAGDDILTGAGSAVSAATTVTITAASGDLDSGGAATLNGTITGNGLVTIAARDAITLGGDVTGSNATITSSNNDLVWTAGTVTGATVTLTAGGADGDIGASGAAVQTAATNVVFTGAGSGDVFITEANGFNVSGSTGSGSVNLVATTGNLVVNSTGVSATGNVNLTSVTGDILRSGAAVISGDVVTIAANAAGGNLGTAAVPLFTDATSLVLTSDGFIGITESNGAIVDALSSGQIVLVATTGNWNVNAVSANTSVTITATAGAILDNNAGALNVSGSQASFTAANGIGTSMDPLETTVVNLVTTTTNTAQFITESDGLNFLDLDAGTADITLISQTGAIANFVGGTNVIADDFIVTAPGGIGGPQPLNISVNTLTATTTNANQSFRESNGLNELNLNAGTGDITMVVTAGSVQAPDGGVDVVADDLVMTLLESGASVALGVDVNTLTATTNNGDQTFIDPNAIAINLLSAGTGTVQVQSVNGAGVTDNNGSALNIIAARARVAGNTGTLADPIETTVDNLEAGGSLFVTETDALIIGGVTGFNGVNGFAGTVVINSGDLTLLENISTGTGAGSVTLNSTGTIVETTGRVQSGSLTTTSVGGQTLNGANLVNSFSATNSGGGNIELTNTAATLAIVQIGNASGATTISNAGNIVLGTATNQNIAVGGIARITATGSMTDGNAAPGDNNITALAAILTAGAGVGTVANPIEIDVANLEGAGGTGGFFVTEADALIIGGITGADDGITANGNIAIAGGALSITEQISSNNHVSLVSTGSITESGAGRITADDLSTVSAGGQTLNGANTIGLFTAANTGAGTDISLQNNFAGFVISTVTNQTGGDVFISNAGNGATITGVVTSGNPVNGGDITIQTGGLLTVNAAVDSRGGSGGTLTISNMVLINASPVVGAGNVTLQGGAGTMTINAPITVSTPLVLTATGDINVLARVETTSVLADLTVLADSDGDGAGGLYLGQGAGANQGQLVSGDDIDARGSEYLGTHVPTLAGLDNSIIIQPYGTNPRISAIGDVLLRNNAAAPAGARIWLGGLVQSSTNGDVVFDSAVLVTNSAARVQTHSDGDVIFMTAVDSAAGAGSPFNLRVGTTDGVVLFNGAVGQVAPLGDAHVDIALDVTIAAPFTAGSLTVTDALGVVNIGGPLTTTDAGLNLSINAVSLLVNAPVNATATGASLGDTLLNVNNIAIAAPVAGDGLLTIQPRDLARTMGVNATGDLNLDSAELDLLADGFDQIVIGHGSATGLLSIGDRVLPQSWLDPVRFLSGDGQIALLGQQVGTGDAAFEFFAPSVTVNAPGVPTVVTAGGLVSFGSFAENAAVTLLTDLEIDSFGGAVTMVGTINGEFDLSIDAGAGAVYINGSSTATPTGTSIGGTTPLASVDITGGTLTLRPNIHTNGAQTYTGTDIQLMGGAFRSLADGAGDIEFNGPVTLNNVVSVGTTNSAITFNGDVNNVALHTTSAGKGALRLDAINGAVTFGGDVGSVFSPKTIEVSSAGQVVLGDDAGDTFEGGLSVYLVTDELDMNGAVSVPGGTLTVLTRSELTGIEIGGAETIGSNDMQLAASDVAALADGTSKLIIGRRLGNAPITIAGPVTFNDPVVFQQPAKTGGAIVIDDTLTGVTADGGFTFNGPATRLNGDIVTAGGSVDIENAVGVGALSTIDTSAGNGNVTFRGGILGATGGESITVLAGSGTIHMNTGLKPPTSATLLGTLTLTSSGTTKLDRGLTVGGLVVDGGGITQLKGLITTTGAAGQTYADAVELFGSTEVRSMNAAGLIHFENTVDSNPATPTKQNNLTVTNRALPASGVTAQFDAPIGQTQALGVFRINTTGDAIFAAGADVIAKSVSLRARTFVVEDVLTTGSQSYTGNGTFNGVINAAKLSITSTADIANTADWTVTGLATLTAKNADISISGANNSFGELTLRGVNASIAEAGNMLLRYTALTGTLNLTTSAAGLEAGDLSQGASRTGALRLEANVAGALTFTRPDTRLSEIGTLVAGDALTLWTRGPRWILLDGSITAGGDIELVANPNGTGGSFSTNGASITLATPSRWVVYSYFAQNAEDGTDLLTDLGSPTIVAGELHPAASVPGGNTLLYFLLSK